MLWQDELMNDLFQNYKYERFLNENQLKEKDAYYLWKEKFVRLIVNFFQTENSPKLEWKLVERQRCMVWHKELLDWFFFRTIMI